QLATAFGTEILNDDGSLNRPILAGKAFSDQQQLQLLNGIMNPPILTQLTKQLDALVTDGQQNILLDAPTLFESGADKLCSKKIAVLASEEIRKSRIMRRDQLTQRQAEERMSSQNSDRYYIWRADYILRNNTSDNELCAQGEALVKHLTSAKKHSSLKVLLLWTAIILAAIFAISGIYRLIFTCMYPQKYANFVIPYANEYEVDPNLVYAVIKCESSFRPNVVSKAQARGLMQITEEAYNWAKSKMGETEIHQYDDLFDPELNIKYGTFILSMLLQEFDSSENALSAYHAGWGNVK
ncbi:MAG: dephospho-CoA kinase, partial [Oscillospiraceae bacterium]